MRLLRSLIAATLVAACGAPCPKCPAPLPPRVVEVRKPCMELPPVLVAPMIPEPQADGSVVLGQLELRKLLIMLGALRRYVETQLERCGETR